MKLLRTIRFDSSDERIFDVAAAPEEWAVPGGFAFAGLKTEDLAGKTRQAFANGFLGLSSFGRSTFATVCEAGEEDAAALVQVLARHFVCDYCAPDEAAALPAAHDEIAFVTDLCKGVPINTLFTLRRHFDEAGEIREEFRIITPPSGIPQHAKIWTVSDEEP